MVVSSTSGSSAWWKLNCTMSMRGTLVPLEAVYQLRASRQPLYQFVP